MTLEIAEILGEVLAVLFILFIGWKLGKQIKKNEERLDELPEDMKL